MLYLLLFFAQTWPSAPDGQQLAQGQFDPNKPPINVVIPPPPKAPAGCTADCKCMVGGGCSCASLVLGKTKAVKDCPCMKAGNCTCKPIGAPLPPAPGKTPPVATAPLPRPTYQAPTYYQQPAYYYPQQYYQQPMYYYGAGGCPGGNCAISRPGFFRRLFGR
jgi:hypothetical protein